MAYRVILPVNFNETNPIMASCSKLSKLKGAVPRHVQKISPLLRASNTPILNLAVVQSLQNTSVPALIYGEAVSFYRLWSIYMSDYSEQDTHLFHTGLKDFNVIESGNSIRRRQK